jgi:ABC-2 type transport system ATP-binding protein
MFFGSLHQIPETDLEIKMEQISNMLNLSQSLDSQTDDLSGGQKRKLMLALAMIHQPKILILDEPTSGVDANSRHEIWKSISSLKNCTILVTSHALEESEQISTKIIVMKTGQVAFSGSGNDLRFEYQCGYLLTDDSQSCQQKKLLAEIQTIIPESIRHPDRNFCITFPSDLRITNLLIHIEEIKDSINLKRYSLHLDSLEHTLLKIIHDQEAQIQDF